MFFIVKIQLVCAINLYFSTILNYCVKKNPLLASQNIAAFGIPQGLHLYPWFTFNNDKILRKSMLLITCLRAVRSKNMIKIIYHLVSLSVLVSNWHLVSGNVKSTTIFYCLYDTTL